MTKDAVIAKLNLYKDLPVEVALNGAGDFSLKGNIDGHWLFTDDTGIVSVVTNSSGTAGSQRMYPFMFFHVDYSDIVYVKAYVDRDNVDTSLAPLTAVGTSKNTAEVLTAIKSSSIFKASSPRGFTTNDAIKPGGDYGAFRGVAVSTGKDGVPEYYKQQ